MHALWESAVWVMKRLMSRLSRLLSKETPHQNDSGYLVIDSEPVVGKCIDHSQPVATGNTYKPSFSFSFWDTEG